MAEARLNFVDHPDGTFSCQAVYLTPGSDSGYDPASHAHQNCRILSDYIGTIREAAPDDGTDEDAEASRPTLATEATMHFVDVGDAFRVRREYLPRCAGFDPSSAAHLGCLAAHIRLHGLNHAVSDALVRDAGDESRRRIARGRINAMGGK